MSFFTTFTIPTPNRHIITLMTPINRWINLYGTPILRDIPQLNCLPFIRGLCDIRKISLPEVDHIQLCNIIRPENAVILTPNHPELYTDWMLDKEISARYAPLTANWATHTIVNGMGKQMQKFWLANHLIAQIPGNSEAALDYSTRTICNGTPVLLHPEGKVAWMRDYIIPLYEGAAKIATNALSQTDRPVYIQPLIWKLQFLRDENNSLNREMRYIENQLGITNTPTDVAERVIQLHITALKRHYQRHNLNYPSQLNYPQAVQHLIDTLAEQLGNADAKTVLIKLREQVLTEQQKQLKRTLQTVMNNVLIRYNNTAWRQEHIAEALKRIRCNDLPRNRRNNIHQIVPRPVGGRIAHIRAIPTIDCRTIATNQLTAILQTKMQNALDDLEQIISTRYQSDVIKIDFLQT